MTNFRTNPSSTWSRLGAVVIVLVCVNTNNSNEVFVSAAYTITLSVTSLSKSQRRMRTMNEGYCLTSPNNRLLNFLSTSKIRKCRLPFQLYAITVPSLWNNNNNNNNFRDSKQLPVRYPYRGMVDFEDYDDYEYDYDYDDISTSVQNEDTNLLTNTLSYLPDHGCSIPPQTKALLEQATVNYIKNRLATWRQNQHITTNTYVNENDETDLISLDNISFRVNMNAVGENLNLREISDTIEREYVTRDVPVHIIIGNNNHNYNEMDTESMTKSQKIVIDVTETGYEVDETIAEVLSLCAFHKVPIAITCFLLSQLPLHDTENSTNSTYSNINKMHLIPSLLKYGWTSVVFPKGLAIVKTNRKLTRNLKESYQLSGIPSNLENLSNSPSTMRSPFRFFRKGGWDCRDKKILMEYARNVVLEASSSTSSHDLEQKILQQQSLLASSTDSVTSRLHMKRYEFLAQIEAQILGYDEVKTTVGDNNNVVHRNYTAIDDPHIINSTSNSNPDVDNDILPTEYVNSIQSSVSFSIPPEDKAIDRNSRNAASLLDRILLTTQPIATISMTPGKLFFPDNIHETTPTIFSSTRMVFRRSKRFVKRKYTSLKQKGRAGFLSYCFFNFLFFTVATLWQWYHVSTTTSNVIVNGWKGEELLSFSGSTRFEKSNKIIHTLHYATKNFLSVFTRPYVGIGLDGGINAVSSMASLSSSALVMCLLKFGRVYAYVFALSQLVKIPEIVASVAMAPLTSQYLIYIKNRWRMSETKTTIVSVAILVLLYVSIISVPLIQEYNRLLQIMLVQASNDEQLLRMFGTIQTV